MVCPHCGQEHPDNTKFCPETGKKIELQEKQQTIELIACDNPVCPDHGKKILPPDSKFCPTCGCPIQKLEKQEFTIYKQLEFYIQNGKVGFRDKDTLKPIIPFEYEDALPPSEGFVAVKKNGFWGFLDIKGHPVGFIKYDSVLKFSEGMAVVCSGNLYGYVNSSGEEVIPLIYEIAYPCSNGRVVARKQCYDVSDDELWVVMDKSGQIIIKPNQYYDISAYKDGYCIAKDIKDNRAYFLDISGNRCFEGAWHPVSPFYNNVAIVAKYENEGVSIYEDMHYGLMTLPDGKVIVLSTKNCPEPVSEGMTIAEDEVINTNGKIIVNSNVYDKIYSFREGLAPISKGGYGFINHNGVLVIKDKYENVLPFSEGLAAVYSNSKWGYIDYEGKTIIPFEYDYAYPFSEGVALVGKEERHFLKKKVVWYLININNKRQKLGCDLWCFSCWETCNFYPDHYNNEREFEEFVNGVQCVGGRISTENYIIDKYGNYKAKNRTYSAQKPKLSKKIIVFISFVFVALVLGSIAAMFVNKTSHTSRYGDDSTVGQDTIYETSKANSYQEENGHEYVDLGLSVKWAKCNLGATDCWGSGYLFAWGETQSKGDDERNYTDKNYFDYKDCNIEDGYTFYKYNIENDCTRLEMQDDAANVIWEGRWRMPTLNEVYELVHNCDVIQTTKKGVEGFWIKSRRNGAKIFLPKLEHNYWTSDLFRGESRPNMSAGIFDACKEDNGECKIEVFHNGRWWPNYIRPVLDNR